jgi:hypothetical protein
MSTRRVRRCREPCRHARPDALQQLHLVERLARADHDALERRRRELDGHVRLQLDPLREAAKQRPAAGERDAGRREIRGELGWGAVEGQLDLLDDLPHGDLEGLANLLARHVDLAWQPADRIAALDLGVEVARIRRHAADVELDPLGGHLADGKAVLVPHPGGHRLVEVVSTQAQRARDDDPSQ